MQRQEILTAVTRGVTAVETAAGGRQFGTIDERAVGAIDRSEVIGAYGQRAAERR